MSADPALQAALAQPVVTLFCAIRIALPARPLCLLDGAGEIAFDAGYGVETFRGADDEFGVIDTVEPVSGGSSDEAPELSLTLFPRDGVAAATLANPAMQGAEVHIFIGALNPATGAVIGAPWPMFLGSVDIVTLNSSQGSRSVEFSIVSVFHDFLATDEGARATDGFHQSIWPGELGLSYVTGTTDTLYWGGTPPAGATAPAPSAEAIIAQLANAGWNRGNVL